MELARPNLFIIAWSTSFPQVEPSSAGPGDNPFEETGKRNDLHRGEWIDLTRLGRWLLDHGGSEPDLRELSDRALSSWLKEVDPEIDPGSLDHPNLAKARLTRLVERWCTRWIPVQKVELDSATDVLHIFTRANLEGVRTSPADIFFAGVKTRWTQAEECLHQLCLRAPFIGRLDALRLVARLASYRLRGWDIVPLSLDRMSGEDGRKLVDTMETIAKSAETLGRLEQVSEYLTRESSLGLALRSLNPHILDHGLGWAMTRTKLRKEQLPEMVGYLFWGSVLRLFPVFRDAFSRLAMELAVNPQKNPFPMAEILAATRARWEELSYRRTAISRPFTNRGKLDPDEARETVDGAHEPFLLVAQEVPFTNADGGRMPSMDWDHIYPQAGKRWMKWHGESGDEKWRFPCPDRTYRRSSALRAPPEFPHDRCFPCGTSGMPSGRRSPCKSDRDRDSSRTGTQPPGIPR